HHPATHKHPLELLDSNLLKSDSVATSFNQGRAFYANLLICQAFLFRFCCLETAWRSTRKLLACRVREAHSTGSEPLVNAFRKTFFTASVTVLNRPPRRLCGELETHSPPRQEAFKMILANFFLPAWQMCSEPSAKTNSRSTTSPSTLTEPALSRSRAAAAFFTRPARLSTADTGRSASLSSTTSGISSGSSPSLRRLPAERW